MAVSVSNLTLSRTLDPPLVPLDPPLLPLCVPWIHPWSPWIHPYSPYVSPGSTPGPLMCPLDPPLLPLCVPWIHPWSPYVSPVPLCVHSWSVCRLLSSQLVCCSILVGWSTVHACSAAADLSVRPLTYASLRCVSSQHLIAGAWYFIDDVYSLLHREGVFYLSEYSLIPRPHPLVRKVCCILSKVCSPYARWSMSCDNNCWHDNALLTRGTRSSNNVLCSACKSGHSCTACTLLHGNIKCRESHWRTETAVSASPQNPSMYTRSSLLVWDNSEEWTDLNMALMLKSLHTAFMRWSSYSSNSPGAVIDTLLYPSSHVLDSETYNLPCYLGIKEGERPILLQL